MKKQNYKSMNHAFEVNRRVFLKSSGLVGAGIVLGTPALWAQDKGSEQKPSKPETNVKDVLNIERTKNSMPGKFPGKVVKVTDSNALVDNVYKADVIQNMFEKGIQSLSGKDMKQTFDMLFTKDDIIGIKVNPVGGGLISTRLELVDSVIKWLTDSGVPKNQIIIWDRFDFMLRDGGFTQERYPGIGIEALQTADEEAPETNDNSRWMDKDGKHLSLSLFDQDVYYYADVEAPQDNNYLNQHVVNTKYSYFGKLLTQKLTKFINVPVFKNTGNGISMATKNIGYAAICNTGRLHKPLFFDVCTEVFAFPCVRDKMVLNITDGLRAV